MGCIFSKEEETGAATKTAKSGEFQDPGVLIQKITSKIDDAAKGAAHHARNVFATPLDDLHSFSLPHHSKTPSERKFIEKALQKNFVFEHLTDKELTPLVGAFEKTSAAKDEDIITQGEAGNYFYVMISGKCAFKVDGKQVGVAKAGDSFGELALLYNCPRAATVTALEEPTELFRVDQKSFRYILQDQTKKGRDDKFKLLKGVPFLAELGDEELAKLVSVSTPKKFSKGDYLIRKGDKADNFYVINEGTLKATNITVGNTKYEDVEIKPGGYAGERAIMTGEPRVADLIAQTDGLAFSIDAETFAKTLGDLKDLVVRATDRTRLSAIKVFVDSEFDAKVFSTLASMITTKKFKKGTKITEVGSPTDAALYLVRSGKIQMTKGSDKQVLEGGAYAGAEHLLADVKSGKNGPGDSTKIKSEITLEVAEDAVCGVLTLASCRKVINTKYLGTPHKELVAEAVKSDIKYQDLKKHTILGAGTFGQVWLVSAEGSGGKREAYALKVQSKSELVKDGQAKAVVNEKNIMAKLSHPFLIRLVTTYKDEKFVYMLLGLVQGGELYSVIHTSRRHGVPDKSAKFYSACVAEGLAYMHRRGYVYRDLKPENVLINAKGYCVIVDFGFAKYVKDKTYTLCGTPLYLPPEVILNRGHNWAADHWSLGVMIFEMITGETPFYEEGMEQMDLFRAIVRCKYTVPRKVSAQASSLIHAFVTKDPYHRLGSLKGGEDDVLNHPWFESIDFEELRQEKIAAPFVPKIKDPLDASNFDDWSHLEDKAKKKYPKLTPEQEKIFDEF